jgi:transcriptional regulatory protein RtcR
MSKKTVVIGFLGSQLDAGQGAGRWEKWRPTVSLVQHQDTLVHRLELLHVPKHEALAKAVQRDIAAVSPETEVRLVSMDIADPWVRIPLIVDTRSRLIADSVPGDRGHPLQVS